MNNDFPIPKNIEVAINFITPAAKAGIANFPTSAIINGAEIAAIEAAQKKANDEDDRRQAYQKQAAIDHQSKLRLQIERNKVRRAEEKQAEFLEKKYIEKVEAEHAYIVANEGGRCNIHHPIKSMKWFT